MSGITLRGMTWDHRRATEPLLQTLPGFRVAHPEVDIVWDKRPLHGFEFTPITDLAQSHDLIILDHPFAGTIAASGCLLPLDALLQGREAEFVGPSLQTYAHSGHIWAVPVDAACQVAVSRPDLLSGLGGDVPQTWAELMGLGRRARASGLSLAIGLRGVHSLMTFFTLCANLGRPFALQPGLGDPVDRETLYEVLDLMRGLLGYSAPECLDWNSIDLHDAMVARDDLVFCPAVYCYATYAEADQPKPLRFHDLPGPQGPQGSTIGGTGLGISAYCGHPESALAYAAYLAQAGTQRTFALHHGQPAHSDCWADPAINERFGGCFNDTRRTMEAAWTRPRHPGYLAFQAEGGTLIEQHLRGSLSAAALVDRIRLAFDASGKPGGD